MTDNLHLALAQALADDNCFERWELPPTRKRRARRKPTLRAMVERAKALGADVTVAPDGSMTLHCGTPPAPERALAPELNGKGNCWDDMLETETRQ